MRNRDLDFILNVAYAILMIIWGIIKYTVLIVWFGTKWIWDEWTDLIKHKKRKLWIAIRTLSIVPITLIWWIWIFLYTHQEELKEWWIQAAWCIITKWKCIKREIRQDMRHDMIENLSWTTITNTWLLQ